MDITNQLIESFGKFDSTLNALDQRLVALGESVDKFNESTNKATDNEEKKFLTAVATDSHRMAISKTVIPEEITFEPIILPKKTIFQLCSLLEDYDGDVKISNVKSKIKFEFNNIVLMSKLIDGKFPNYFQVIPKDNQKKLEIDLKPFPTSNMAGGGIAKEGGVDSGVAPESGPTPDGPSEGLASLLKNGMKIKE